MQCRGTQAGPWAAGTALGGAEPATIPCRMEVFFESPRAAVTARGRSKWMETLLRASCEQCQPGEVRRGWGQPPGRGDGAAGPWGRSGSRAQGPVSAAPVRLFRWALGLSCSCPSAQRCQKQGEWWGASCSATALAGLGAACPGRVSPASPVSPACQRARPGLEVTGLWCVS